MVKYLSNAELYISPAHPDAELLSRRAKEDPVSVIEDHSYWYLRYAIPDEETGLAFLKHYREQTEAGVRLLEDIELKSRSIFRLRQDVVEFKLMPNYQVVRHIGGILAPLYPYNPDVINISCYGVPQSLIPVMIERTGLHKNGANVLFYDGHIEFMEYPGPFPMTQKFITALEALDELKATGNANH